MLGAVKISFVQAEVALNSPHSCAALKKTSLVFTAQPNMAKSEFQPVHHVNQRRLSTYKKNDPTPENTILSANNSTKNCFDESVTQLSHL